MKIPVRSLLAIRKASTAVSTVETVAPATLSSEFFEHIRHQVYGDAQKVDKVVVSVLTNEKTLPVLVNRNVSTAYQCLNHVSKHVADDALLVEVIPSVGSAYFASPNQPLQNQANIRKIGFKTAEHVSLVNDAYWRSCSFVTAAILKDSLDVDVDLQFPGGSIQDGFFSVKVSGLGGNVFTPDELNAINRLGKTVIHADKPLEVISVPQATAEENGISGTHLVRIDDHVFSSDGPVIRSTRQIGRFLIFRSKPSGHDIVVGGVSLPRKQTTSSYTWGLIAKNAVHKFSKTV
ncbi:unnamed protein product [Caenorhabditis sp. 36 PRJEB53466]|nr:unnamed protein product [Caenorhabditis sp. 36 PRJEB53466]